MLTASAAAVVIITIAGLGVEHIRHDAVDGIELAGDPAALPLCRATTPIDRTDIASIEE